MRESETCIVRCAVSCGDEPMLSLASFSVNDKQEKAQRLLLFECLVRQIYRLSATVLFEEGAAA